MYIYICICLFNTSNTYRSINLQREAYVGQVLVIGYIRACARACTTYVLEFKTHTSSLYNTCLGYRHHFHCGHVNELFKAQIRKFISFIVASYILLDDADVCFVLDQHTELNFNHTEASRCSQADISGHCFAFLLLSLISNIFILYDSKVVKCIILVVKKRADCINQLPHKYQIVHATIGKTTETYCSIPFLVICMLVTGYLSPQRCYLCCYDVVNSHQIMTYKPHTRERLAYCYQGVDIL